MKRLVGNALGLVIFLLLIQWALSIMPAIASTAANIFSQLAPPLSTYYTPAPLSWPEPFPGDVQPAEPMPEESPTEEPVPGETPPDVPTPVVTPDPSVEPTPEPVPTITWICPIQGEGGC